MSPVSEITRFLSLTKFLQECGRKDERYGKFNVGARTKIGAQAQRVGFGNQKDQQSFTRLKIEFWRIK